MTNAIASPARSWSWSPRRMAASAQNIGRLLDSRIAEAIEGISRSGAWIPFCGHVSEPERMYQYDAKRSEKKMPSVRMSISMPHDAGARVPAT